MLYHLAVLLAGRGLSLGRRRGGARWPPPLSPMGRQPTLDEARTLARRGATLVPVTPAFVEDCETPVSAFLKLRGDGPAFLLESAEQGQRRPLVVHRLAPRSGAALERSGDGGRPATRSPHAEVADHSPGAGAGPAAVRRRRRGLLRLRLRARGRAPASPTPTPLGLPDMALMLSDVIVAFDHLRHTVTILANAYLDDEGGLDAAHARAVEAIAGGARPARRTAAPARSPSGPPGAPVRIQHAARAVRGDGRADRRVHPRRRRLPGGAEPALVRADAGRAVLDLPRPARGQPESVHVLPRLRGLPARRAPRPSRC